MWEIKTNKIELNWIEVTIGTTFPSLALSTTANIEGSISFLFYDNF